MEQKLSKTKEKSQKWAKMQLLGWCANWDYWSADQSFSSANWHILSPI